MSLRDEVISLARAHREIAISEREIEHVCLAAIKLVLEREPSGDILQAMDEVYLAAYPDGIDDAVLVAMHRAITARFLKELE